MKPKQLPISRIELDLLNPRHDTDKDTQEKIIDHLIENEKIKVLARDIALNGLSPIELIAVIKNDSGKYTVVEGNRRICALTLLTKPNKHLASKSYFEKLKKSSDKIPQNVECTIFSTREDAALWIERRHSGQQDGKGATQWDSEQKTRFNTRRGKTDNNALAQAILEYAISKGFFPAEEAKGLLTTVTRYVSNPYFRNTLGLRGKSTSNKIKIDVPLDKFEHVIKIFCSNLLEKNTISSRHNKKEIEHYARQLVENKEAPNNRTDVVIEVPSSTADSDKPIESIKTSANAGNPDTSTNGKKSYDSAHPDNRKNLIHHTFKATIHDHILRRSYGELKSIPINDQPLASAMVCRVFLENLYERYHHAIQGNHTDMDTNKRIGKIAALIREDNELTKLEKNALAALERVHSTQGHVFSPKTLGANAHGGYYPNATDLKREWDNISHVVQYMINKIAT